MIERIAIVHYHLRRGGVTRVMENTLRALETQGIQCAILTGEPPNWDCPFPYQVVEGLGYRTHGTPDQGKNLARALQEAAQRGLDGRSPDVWHFHNHSLGKNVLLTSALASLREAGQRLLLQIHDFAEDNRPSNYAVLQEGTDHGRCPAYVWGTGCRLAVLNQRDHSILQEAGVPQDRLHLLPNPVEVPEEIQTGSVGPLPSGPPLWLYPTRAIRRKNLGESVLWASLHRHEERRIGISLAPENPRERVFHDAWKQFAQDQSIPVEFEMGKQAAFEDLIQSSEALLTTSVAEGFGLAFLEPWLFGKAVLGRNLQDITGDFVQQGILLDHLYDRLPVPWDWLDRTEVEQRLRTFVHRQFHAYDLAPSPVWLAKFEEGINRSGPDFGMLDEALQREVIEKLMKDPGMARSVEGWRIPALPEPSRIETNAQRIRHGFGVPAYGERLRKIYEDIASENDSVSTGTLAPEAVVRQFLAPHRLTLLRA